MEIIPFKEIDSHDWDQFCSLHPMAWFWHSSYRISHALDCSYAIDSINKSFAYLHEGEIVAIVPLTVDCHKETSVTEISYGGFGTPIPLVSSKLSQKKYLKLYKNIFCRIDEIAQKQDVVRAEFLQTLTYPYHSYFNIALKYGYSDYSLMTQVIDLTKDETKLWKGLDTNHSRAITKAKKHLEVKIFDYTNINKKIFDGYQNFYSLIAGKGVRPQTTFNLAYHYLKNNMSIMGIAYCKEKAVGYVIMIYYKEAAYYVTGANVRDFNLCPIAHVIHWEMMLNLKKKGIKNYESGIQQFGNLIHNYPSLKDINISRFKRGFGGKTIPRFGAEKFYDKSYAKEILKKRFDNYLKNI